MLAVVEGVSVARARSSSASSPAQAQFGDQRYPFLQRQHQRSRRLLPGPVRRLLRARAQGAPAAVQQRRRASTIRARRRRTSRTRTRRRPPTTTIVVMGDGMADWLAYGLEDAFSDTPAVGIVRKYKLHSGLIRYRGQERSRLVARRARHPRAGEGELRGHDARPQRPPEHPRARPRQGGGKAAGREGRSGEERKRKRTADKSADKDKNKKAAIRRPRREAEAETVQRHHRIPQRPLGDGLSPSASTRPSPRSRARACRCSGSACRRSAAAKSTADAVYLNDLFRARAERAGIVYIDVWDGFVDDGGKYSSYGPDYEGQIRRLRSGDGVYLHQIRRAQARPLCRARDPPLHEQPLAAGDAADRAGGPCRSAASRRCGRWPGRWCR